MQEAVPSTTHATDRKGTQTTHIATDLAIPTMTGIQNALVLILEVALEADLLTGM